MVRTLGMLSPLAFVASCVVDPGVGSVLDDEVVSKRPHATGFTALPGNPGPWRKISVALNKRILGALYKSSSNLVLEITDCAGSKLESEKLYYDGAEVTELGAYMTKAAFDEFYQKLPDEIEASIYLSSRFFQEHEKLCATFMGGSMVGHVIRRRAVVLK